MAELELARKSIFAVHIRPVNAALTLKARKLQIALSRLAGQQYRRLPEERRREVESELHEHVRAFREGRVEAEPVMLRQVRFRATVQELAAVSGHDVSDARHLWSDLKRLQGVQVEFNVLRHQAAKADRDQYPYEMEVVASLVSSMAKGRQKGTRSLLIEWGYDPLIFGVMVNPQTYAQLSLQLVRNARTYAALALYENTKRFVGIGRAGPYPVPVWQRLLDEEGIVRAWENIREFKRKLKRVLAELEAVEGCDIALEPRFFTADNGERMLEFGVRMREQELLPFGEPLPPNTELAGRLREIGFSAQEARGLVDAHGEHYLLTKLSMLDRARDVRNPKAWIRAAIQRDFKDEEARREEDQRKARELKHAETTLERLRDAWQRQRRAHALARFEQLPLERQEDLRASFMMSDDGGKVAAQHLPRSALEAAFVAWLARQEGWLTDPADCDFNIFVLLASKMDSSALANDGRQLPQLSMGGASAPDSENSPEESSASH